MSLQPAIECNLWNDNDAPRIHDDIPIPIFGREQGQPLVLDGFDEDEVIQLLIAGLEEGIDYENSWEPEPTNSQSPTAIQIPGTLVTHDVTRRDGSGLDRPGCRSNCCAVFAGPHKCSGRGKSLKISCRENNCQSKFTKRSDFNRHYRGAHCNERNSLDCPYVGCSRSGRKGFTRKDNLTQHRRSVHGEHIPKNPIRFGQGK